QRDKALQQFPVGRFLGRLVGQHGLPCHVWRAPWVALLLYDAATRPSRMQQFSPLPPIRRFKENGPRTPVERPAMNQPDSQSWYYVRDRQTVGPVPWHHLRQLAAAHQLGPADMVLEASSSQWLPASAVPGLLPASSPGDEASTSNALEELHLPAPHAQG